MSVLYDDVVKIWIDDNKEKHRRLTRIYVTLRASQKDAIRDALTAIRHENASNFVNNKRKFNDIQKLISEEFKEYDLEDREAGFGLEFPEWPYDIDEEVPYVLYDDLPQYEDVDAVDVPF